MTTQDCIIQAKDIAKLYSRGEEKVWALKGVSIDIQRGEFLAIMGPSGSGKSTLFNQLGALDRPTEGKVFFERQSLFDLSDMQQAWVRCNKIGYIFQTFNLVPVLSALQNVMLPATFKGLSQAEATEAATKVLERVGLGHRMHHKPGELSGGQQQRVAIARALANTPAVVLADEPTGNLDSKTGTEIVELLRQLNKEQGVTVICSTHDPKMIAKADRVCSILDGKIEYVADPSDERVKAFLAHH
jgi:putative ABC transport system ATP-binding protein